MSIIKLSPGPSPLSRNSEIPVASSPKVLYSHRNSLFCQLFSDFLRERKSIDFRPGTGPSMRASLEGFPSILILGLVTSITRFVFMVPRSHPIINILRCETILFLDYARMEEDESG